jgi:hypothetical protein
MTFELEVGDEKKAFVHFYRNCFTGTMRLKINGQVVAWQSALSPLTHIGGGLVRTCQFLVWPGDTRSELTIVHARPRWFGGLRPQSYIVLWNRTEIARFRGY